MLKKLFILIFTFVIILGVFSFQFFGLKQILAQSAFVSGFISIWNGSEVVKLNVVPVDDAVSAGHGVVKIEMSDGAGAADLGLTNDPDASNVRVRTPYGTRAWKQFSSFRKHLWFDFETYPSELGKDIIQLADGSFVLTGRTLTYRALSIYDMFILKLDSDAETVLWAKTIPDWGNRTQDIGNSIIQTSDGGFAVATKYNNSGFIFKFDSLGEVMWTRRIGGRDAPDVIQTSPDGGYLVIADGYVWPDFFSIISKLDSSGNPVWTKKVNIGLYDDLYLNAIIQTSDNNYVAVGSAYTIKRSLVVKFNSLGEEIWSKRISSMGEATSIVENDDGNYVIAGHQITGDSRFDTFANIAKIDDTTGNVLWAKTIDVPSFHTGGAATGRAVETHSVIETLDGDLILAGLFRIQNGLELGPLLTKVNSTGAVEWLQGVAPGTNGYQVEKRYESVIQGNDGKYVVIGGMTYCAGSACIIRISIANIADNGSCCRPDFIVAQANESGDDVDIPVIFSDTSAGTPFTLTAISRTTNIKDVCWNSF